MAVVKVVLAPMAQAAWRPLGCQQYPLLVAKAVNHLGSTGRAWYRAAKQQPARARAQRPLAKHAAVDREQWGSATLHQHEAMHTSAHPIW